MCIRIKSLIILLHDHRHPSVQRIVNKPYANLGQFSVAVNKSIATGCQWLIVSVQMSTSFECMYKRLLLIALVKFNWLPTMTMHI